MKRSVIMGLLFGMAACMLVGAASPATVKLWNWNVHDKKYQQKMYKLFNQEHPDIKIEYSSISNTVFGQTVEASFVAKEPPDLFTPDNNSKYGFTFLKDKGLIKPLKRMRSQRHGVEGLDEQVSRGASQVHGGRERF